MKKNIHDSHAVAIFARKNYGTDKTQWALRMCRHGDKTPEAEAVEFRWRIGQNWFANHSEMELWLATIKAGRKLLIRADRIGDLIHFLERIEPAAANEGYVPVHTEESAEVI